MHFDRGTIQAHPTGAQIIDADQALNLYKQISFRRWRTKEPLDDPCKILIEQPRLLKRAVELLLESGKRQPEDILNELRLSADWIEAFCALEPGTLRKGQSEAFAPTEPTLK